MKNKTLLILCCGLLLTANLLKAQTKFGDNKTVINPNSVVEIESTNKGLLLPRIALTMTTAPAPLSAHVAGMYVYNTATAGTMPNNVTPGTYYNDGTKWVKAGGIDTSLLNDWHITGNYGTVPPTTVGTALGTFNYWGTADAQNLAVGTNNTTRAIFDQNGSLYGGTATFNAALNPLQSLVWGNDHKDSANNTAVSGQNNALSPSATYSFVSGINNTLTGTGTTVSGYNHRVTGIRSAVSGGGNIDSANNTSVSGQFHILSPSAVNSSVSGQSNIVKSAFSSVSGQGNNVQGSSLLVAGGANTIAAGTIYSIVGGFSNTVIGSYSTVSGSTNIDSAIYSLVSGSSNTLHSAATNSAIIGTGITGTAANTLYANNVYVPGAIKYGSLTAISDRRFKSNFRPMGYGLTTVMQLQPQEYEQVNAYRVKDGKPVTTDSAYTGSHHSFGFVAQDLYKVIPEAVKKPADESTDNWGVDYARLVPVLTKAIQEQQAQLRANEAKYEVTIAALKAEIEAIKALLLKK